MLAIGGLGTAILKSATLCSTPAAWPLAPMLFQVSCWPVTSAALWLAQATGDF